MIIKFQAALFNIDNVIRIHTDCVTFTEPIEFNNENLVLEDKTSGLVKWIACSSYYNTTNEYKSLPYKKFIDKQAMSQEDDIHIDEDELFYNGNIFN